MSEMVIDRAEVFVVAPEVERYTWAEGMTDQYMANIILRLTSQDGLEGVAGAAMITSNGFDRAVGETLRFLLPEIIGASALAREAVWYRLRPLGTPLVPQAVSLIDIALWDMVAKAAGLPLYQFLGGARSKVLSYASTPLLHSDQGYIDYIRERMEEGYRAIKFHCWCNPERDLPMCEAVRGEFDGKIALMLDVEQRYDLRSALRVGKRIAALDFEWFEAPLPDTDLEGYRQLKRETGVPIIPAGNTWLDLQQIAQAIRLDCWDSIRVDATICGGITPIRKIMALAEAYGKTVEVQCWGYTLTQAANLHVMLGYCNCRYFEQPSPYPAFEYGSLDMIRTDRQGYVHAPPGAGLGVGIDWAAVKRATILDFEIRKRTMSS
jgi:L-alanine-DL-glutamate epimerase-like enolase superfamily enzyme